MKDNFDLKKYLTENKLTPLSKHSKEHPDFISYKGAKYRRVGLVNEIVVAPTGRYTLFKNQDDPLDDNILQFKDYIGYIRGATALDAWKAWFNESGEKEIEKIFDGEDEDGRYAEDVEDFFENSGVDHEENQTIELNGKTLMFDIIRHPVEIPNYFIFHGRLSQEDINDIVSMEINGVFDLLDGR